MKSFRICLIELKFVRIDSKHLEIHLKLLYKFVQNGSELIPNYWGWTDFIYSGFIKAWWMETWSAANGPKHAPVCLKLNQLHIMKHSQGHSVTWWTMFGFTFGCLDDDCSTLLAALILNLFITVNVNLDFKNVNTNWKLEIICDKQKKNWKQILNSRFNSINVWRRYVKRCKKNSSG